MKTDTIFTKPISKQFEFDAEVAAVFDDMLLRSVPFYKESQELTLRFAINALKKGGIVYDLGCSTASLLLAIERVVGKIENIRLIGIDNSTAMIEHARKKIDAYGSKIELYEGDILQFPYEKGQVIVSNYTLQFIRPLVRDTLVRNIADILNEEGVFIFSEKVVSEDPRLNKELIDCYYDFKKSQGYSEYEIVQKREALENVLIPYTMNENIQMAKNSGFKTCEVLFRWANFATFIATK
ncbi:carboxy-S-adenosyl-L-methionine synthase CmoA [Sulfuricurvum sp.]|uniref:carboxy-S-adenosyl-L-methionine synthase CmoA n=1 Tax=Sulfuricurvum sp. TaxID=2025608 RepID=UPI0019C02078|nr:carboxy-S-adenosyl-L-methionine synthase CmoA [Sulfuricurvum sp.]MBD3799081.1 carboxy-S-adenosyl-L-methionine synthase CmoA [Campylobacterota bacterium]MBD3806447.1 carboxy-S-adenosyl-L-methionine synthase CmoA [Sulfuricurvum sp.]